MVKAIWAVACAVLVLVSFTMLMVLPVCAEEAKGFADTTRNVPVQSDNSVRGVPLQMDNSVRDLAGQMDKSMRIRKPVSSLKNAQGDPSYRLGPEDQLRISVWDNKELTLDLVVRPDGKISMPLIQDVVAEDLTATQLAADIQEKLSAYIINPEVSVIVLQVNAPKYYIIGYVARPGTYPLRGETSVLQALALAGGMTQFASPRSIKLIRAVGGRQEVRKINYYDIVEDGGGNYLLKPGDTIVVP